MTTTPQLRTRPPTGKAAWPLILLEGEEKAGKSFGAYALSASPLVHRTFVFDLGDGTADEYADLGPYEVVDLTGTYSDLVEQIRAATAVPPGPHGEPNVYIIDSGTDLWNLLKDWAGARARRSKKGRDALAADPDAEVDTPMNLWNDAKDRWATVVNLLRRSGGIGIITAQGSEVTKIENGQPTRDTTWSVNAEKTIPAAATCWVRVQRDPRRYTLVGARRLGLEVPRGGMPLPVEGTLHHLVFEVIGAGATFSAPTVQPATLGLTHKQAKRRLLDAIQAAWPALSKDEAQEEARSMWIESGLEDVEDIGGAQIAMLLDAVGAPESDSPPVPVEPDPEPENGHEVSQEPPTDEPPPEPAPDRDDYEDQPRYRDDAEGFEDLVAHETLGTMADEMIEALGEKRMTEDEDGIRVPPTVELSILTASQINAMRKIECVAALSERGLPTAGTVEQLRTRLAEHEAGRS